MPARQWRRTSTTPAGACSRADGPAWRNRRPSEAALGAEIHRQEACLPEIGGLDEAELAADAHQETAHGAEADPALQVDVDEVEVVDGPVVVEVGVGAAGVAAGPIVLANGPELASEVQDAVAALRPRSIVVLGGTSVLPASLESLLATLLGDG